MLKIQIIVFLAFLCLGCDGRFPKPQGRSNGSKPAENGTLPEDAEIELAVHEYLVRNVIKPSGDLVVFVSLSDAERRRLSAKLPRCTIKPANSARITSEGVEDTTSGDRGVIVEVKSISRAGRRASVRAGYFGGAGVTFDLELQLTDSWTVRTASRPTIAD